jgi:hypothetical protein
MKVFFIDLWEQAKEFAATGVCNAQKTVLLKKNIRNLQVGEI